jgi:hypothetical protein
VNSSDIWLVVFVPRIYLYGDTEFTVLLVQVLNVSHPLALEGSSVYAKQLVERFFRKYTRIDPALVKEHAHKFLRLAADSQLEIAFVGRPVGFQAPSYKIYKYEPSEALSILCEVEVRDIEGVLTSRGQKVHRMRKTQRSS